MQYLSGNPEWQDGDVITAQKLNNLEQSVDKTPKIDKIVVNYKRGVETETYSYKDTGINFNEDTGDIWLFNYFNWGTHDTYPTHVSLNKWFNAYDRDNFWYIDIYIDTYNETISYRKTWSITPSWCKEDALNEEGNFILYNISGFKTSITLN